MWRHSMEDAGVAATEATDMLEAAVDVERGRATEAPSKDWAEAEEDTPEDWAEAEEDTPNDWAAEADEAPLDACTSEQAVRLTIISGNTGGRAGGSSTLSDAGATSRKSAATRVTGCRQVGHLR